MVTQALIQAAKALPNESGIGVDKMIFRMTNNENDTALHEAVRYNHPDVLKLLILEDPDFIYGANFSGGTPLYMATMSRPKTHSKGVTVILHFKPEGL